MATLAEVLSYQNDKVLDCFLEKYYFERARAREVFDDVLTWLWLASEAPDDRNIGMYHPMQVMDQMWHTFLSCTRDYQSFCETMFGRMIHHEPHTRREQVAELTSAPDPTAKFEEMKGDVAAFQARVHDTLGPEVLLRWFLTYPHVYSPEEMLRRTRPKFSERGFQIIERLRSSTREDILGELARTHDVALWCGGPNCGPQCQEDFN